MSPPVPPVLLLAVALGAAPAAAAATGPPTGSPVQRVAREWFESSSWGFKFKPVDGFEAVPLRPDELGGPLVARMSGPIGRTKSAEGTWEGVELDLRVFAFPEPPAADGGEPRARRTLAEELVGLYRGFHEDVARSPEEVRPFKVGRVDGTRRTWTVEFQGVQAILDTWTFHLADVDVGIVYTCTPEDRERSLTAFERSANTLRLVERTVALPPAAAVTYEEMLARAERECAATSGWRALATPSRKYIVKTSSDNRRFLENVVERLERSRELFEQDLPLLDDPEHVAIVRICSDFEEFRSYGATDASTAGWFDPDTGELVLYDAVDVDRNKSYAVVSHEAFHQYCHELFDGAPAHPWFEEGQGDYYGGLRVKAGRPEVSTRMPAGLDRLSVVRELVRAGEHAPLAEHLGLDHARWRRQGPDDVSPYAQSWSLVYMLRQGALGRVHSSCWREEYARILPDYVAALRRGLVAERRASRAMDDEVLPGAGSLGLVLDLDERRRLEVWRRALDASFGRVDLERLEEDWITYVDRYLK